MWLQCTVITILQLCTVEDKIDELQTDIAEGASCKADTTDVFVSHISSQVVLHPSCIDVGASYFYRFSSQMMSNTTLHCHLLLSKLYPAHRCPCHFTVTTHHLTRYQRTNRPSTVLGLICVPLMYCIEHCWKYHREQHYIEVCALLHDEGQP